MTLFSNKLPESMLNKILLLFTCLISATVTQAADVTVFQGYQTTGQGNRNSVLLKIKMPKDSVFIRTMNVTLKGNTLKDQQAGLSFSDG